MSMKNKKLLILKIIFMVVMMIIPFGFYYFYKMKFNPYWTIPLVFYELVIVFIIKYIIKKK
jgi:hypothetical protein